MSALVGHIMDLLCRFIVHLHAIAAESGLNWHVVGRRSHLVRRSCRSSLVHYSRSMHGHLSICKERVHFLGLGRISTVPVCCWKKECIGYRHRTLDSASLNLSRQFNERSDNKGNIRVKAAGALERRCARTIRVGFLHNLLELCPGHLQIGDTRVSQVL